MSLNQPFEVSHQENSRSSNNRHFDKQQRKRSYHRGSQSDRLHRTHHPIDLSSRTDTPADEINLLSKVLSFCPIPRDIKWYKCRQDWQAFVDKCDGQIFTLIVILTL